MRCSRMNYLGRLLRRGLSSSARLRSENAIRRRFAQKENNAGPQYVRRFASLCCFLYV